MVKLKVTPMAKLRQMEIDLGFPMVKLKEKLMRMVIGLDLLKEMQMD